jgi:hypothetical protein
MKVLFLGFADLSVDLGKYYLADYQIWTMNDYYKWFPDLMPNMIFEIHQPGAILNAQKTGRFPGDWKDIYNKSGADVVTRWNHGLDNECDVHITPLIDLLGERFFAGTFSYMFGWAVMMKAKSISIEGIHLKTNTEYQSQVHGMVRNIDAARRRGIEVTVPGGWEPKWRALASSTEEIWTGIYGDSSPDNCNCESCKDFRAKFVLPHTQN